jgi:hypothetical protein
MIRVTFALCFGSALLLAAQTLDQTPEQALTSAAAQLAARTSSLLPRRATVSLELQNLTPLPATEWSSFRSLLQDQLHKAGVETAGLETAATPPESRVRVTLSEDTRGLLFVAEVFTGDNRQIAMLPWNLPASAHARSRVRITNKVLWTQPDPILDILLVDSGSQMLVLSANRVASYRLMEDKWTPSSTDSLVLSRPLPRDPRGRLEATADGFRAYLPTATCDGTWKPELRLTCLNGTATWPDTPARWMADRNDLESEAMKPPFYTSAGGVFAMVDGRVQDRAGQPVAGSENWGSDLAGIDEPCGAAFAVIASSANAEREEVRVYEVANNQATPASDAMPLPGPVTALWPAESHAQATLVVRNLQTGTYEASRLGLACTE